MSIVALFRKLVFGFDLADVEAEKLGFIISDRPKTADRIQRIIDCFINSYNSALENAPQQERLVGLLNMLEPDLRGFGHEGAAMGITMADILRRKSRRGLIGFTQGAGASHSYMAYIGAGIALAATFRKPSVYWAELDPLTRWLVYNGFGFHNAFFKTEQTLYKHRVPKHIAEGPAQHEFDAGIGRGLWFVLGADPDKMTKTISDFPEARQADIWSGVGLASAYACGVDREHIEAVFHSSGPHQAALAQGAVLAAHTRHRAGNPVPHLDMVTHAYWGQDSVDLHQMAQASIEYTQTRSSDDTSEHWTRFIEDLRMRHQRVAHREVA